MTNIGLLKDLDASLIKACASDSLNTLMDLTPAQLSTLRLLLSRLLRHGGPDRSEVVSCLVDATNALMRMPADVRNFSDFFTSIHHASNTGRMLRPHAPLQPNFHHLPVGYHARSSTLRVSGTPLCRPCGQQIPKDMTEPVYEPSRRLDFECEVAIHIGRGNELGKPIRVDQADESIFGVSLLNDWSSRDLQTWESAPLGPFLAKSSLTTLSPWIVTTEALAPFRVAAVRRASNVPSPLPYLLDTKDQVNGGIDIQMEIYLQTEQGRERGLPATLISSPNFRDQYWTPAQMLAHQTSNGCVVEPGDIIGSGTVSGPVRDQLGCLLELTQGGTLPLELPTGELRAFLEDGDEVEIRGRCVANGAVPIGFGVCAGRIHPCQAG
ncbi:fumarylacetoacetase [Ottowia thiooxydans]|uniref:Fumarylacetoacetase n=2 Tax=Ottowia thiooxydans TaxID=219182 RepID=A0ABV2QHI0_9BURK